jgi:hypothetical protein
MKLLKKLIDFIPTTIPLHLPPDPMFNYADSVALENLLKLNEEKLDDDVIDWVC